MNRKMIRLFRTAAVALALGLVACTTVSPIDFYLSATAKVKQGDVEGAITDFSRAIALEPDVASSYYGRARLYDQKGDTERSIADYNQVVRLAPNDTVYILRG